MNTMQARRKNREWIDLHSIYKTTPITPKTGRKWRIVRQGQHTVLWNGQLGKAIMSDHPSEQLTCEEFLESARGRVLVLGLGLGYILFPLLQDPDIVSIDVVELEPEIIEMVEPFVKSHDSRDIVKIHQGDAATWWQEKVASWDSVYVDLWYAVTGDEREQALELYQRYRDLTLPGGWCSYWDPHRHGERLVGASVPR